MADTKITALTAISSITPATFPLPIVDLLDTTMAGSGTTKKVTVNQILGCGGTATLASATITGDLTVDTSTLKVDSANNRVGIVKTTPAYPLDVGGRISYSGAIGEGADTTVSSIGTSLLFGNAANWSECQFFAGGNLQHRMQSAGVFTWYDGAGGTRMTLNSTGLGVGVTPSAWSGITPIQISRGSFAADTGSFILSQNVYNNGSNRYIATAAAMQFQAIPGTGFLWNIAPSGTAGNAITFTQAMTLDASGNLLVGTTTNTNNSRVFVRNGNAANPTLALQGITGDVGQAGLLVGKFDNDSTTSQILVRFTINNNAGGSGQINANGASQAAFGSYSDSRLKENIVSLPSQLANILSLRPVEFDYKDGSGHQIGFVAQEIQEVYSDAVGEQNGFLTVTGWSKTEARLVSAIKELAAKVQALEAKLA